MVQKNNLFCKLRCFERHAFRWDSEENLEEDPELVSLRNLILSKIEEHCTQELIPITWLLIEDKVYEIRDKSHDKIIPFEKLVEVGVEQCSMKSSNEVSDALSHLHNFSIVVYFSSSPILRHHVFIDAQCVFTSLSRLCPLHSTGLPAIYIIFERTSICLPRKASCRKSLPIISSAI